MGTNEVKLKPAHLKLFSSNSIFMAKHIYHVYKLARRKVNETHTNTRYKDDQATFLCEVKRTGKKTKNKHKQKTEKHPFMI